MGNKSELQIHNLDLQSILQTVNSQPAAVPWGGATDIIAGTQDIVIPAYTDTQLTVKGDADLIASNIKKGIELFGVTGTLVKGQDVDFGEITPSQYASRIYITTTKPRSKLIISSAWYRSGSWTTLTSTSETEMRRVDDGTSSVVTFSVNGNTIEIYVGATGFDGYSKVYYCAYN